MVFVSKKQRQNLINFLNDANLHTFFYFLKKSLVYYNILTCELLTPKGISFGDCCLFSFPASSCHGFLGHGVGHPPLGSPQA